MNNPPSFSPTLFALMERRAALDRRISELEQRLRKAGVELGDGNEVVGPGTICDCGSCPGPAGEVGEPGSYWTGMHRIIIEHGVVMNHDPNRTAP